MCWCWTPSAAIRFPIHLLTREAFDIYLPHLAPGGALAVHVSNRHLDLAPVVYGLAEHFEFDAVRIFTTDAQHGGWSAEWIILSRNQELLKTLRAAEGNQAPRLRRRHFRCGPTSGTICWTF